MTKLSLSRLLWKVDPRCLWCQSMVRSHHGKISMESLRRLPLFNTHTLMLVWIICTFTQSTPKPTPQVVCECAWAKNMPPQPFPKPSVVCTHAHTATTTATEAGARGRPAIHTLRCLPSTPSTCEQITHQTVTTVAGAHKSHNRAYGLAQA